MVRNGDNLHEVMFIIKKTKKSWFHSFHS